MKLISYIIFIAIGLSMWGCGPILGDDCDGWPLEFDLPLQAYGIKDTLNIGDTIRVRLDIPDRLPERNSGIDYDFIDYEFYLITYMVRIDTLPILVESAAIFDWATIEGQSKYVAGIYQVYPDYYDNIYHYEMRIIAKQKGLFEFGMNSIADRALPLKKLKGPCSRRPVAVYTKLINDTNTNFEFYQYSPEPAYVNLSRKRFDEFAGFCFFVR